MVDAREEVKVVALDNSARFRIKSWDCQPRPKIVVDHTLERSWPDRDMRTRPT